MRQFVGPHGSRGIPPVRHSRLTAASAVRNGAGGRSKGRRLHKWTATFSVVALLMLGSSPAFAEEAATDPAAGAGGTSEAALVESGAAQTQAAPTTEAPAAEPPAAAPEAAPAAPAAEAPAPSTDPAAAPIEPAPPAADPPAASAPGAAPSGDAAGPSESDASTSAAPNVGATAPVQATAEDPFSPPYLRWMVTDATDATGAAVTVPTIFTLEGPSDPNAAPDAEEAILWNGALSAEIEDNIGQAGYTGLDLDVRVGWFAVMQLVDGQSATAHDVVPGEHYRVRVSSAPAGYLSGDSATWASMDVLTDVSAVPATISLAFDTGMAAFAETQSDIGILAVGNTTINIKKIGDRTGPGLTDGAPVQGATYSAYDSTGGQNAAPTGPVLGTCVTNATGVCSIVVPNDHPNGVWIQETGTPTGWSNLPSLGIGNYDSSKTVTPYRFRVEVGAGMQNRVENVSADANRPNTTNSGAWVNMRNNPDFPQACGISIATVFDTSSSISSSEMTAFKNAAQLFVGTAGLGGTPSLMTMFSFDTTAQTMNSGTAYDLAVPGSAFSNTGYLGASNRIQTGLPNSGDGYTNWDAALRLVNSTGNYDLVLFLTDGDPTTYGSGNVQSTTVNFRGIEQAVMSANALKSEVGPSLRNTKIVGVGVGLSNGSDGNLQAITGPTINDDYFLTSSFDALKDKLSEIAFKNCGSTLTVVKQLQNADGQVVSSNTAGWEFTATGSVVNGSPAVQTTTTSGTNFSLTFNDQLTHTVTVAETPQPDSGYEYLSTICANAAGDVVQTTTGFTVPVSQGLITSCTVINREVAHPATLQLDKTWVIEDGAGNVLSTYYQRGIGSDPAVPAWLDATPTVSPAPNPAPPGGVDWGEAYGGYDAGDSVVLGENTTLDLSEHVGCELTSQELTDINGVATHVAMSSEAAQTFPAQILNAGANKYGITNTVTCITQLTLLKQVDLTQMPNSSLQPSDWTLTAAAGGTPVLNAVTGATVPSAANTASVAAGTNYQLTEASVSGQLAYVQLGIQECKTVTGFGPTATCAEWETGYLSGSEVAVDLGQHGIYRFVNQPIPPLTVPLTGGMSAELISLGGAGILILALLLGVVTTQRRSRRQWEVR